jgi:hypothetical protein
MAGARRALSTSRCCARLEAPNGAQPACAVSMHTDMNLHAYGANAGAASDERIRACRACQASTSSTLLTARFATPPRPLWTLRVVQEGVNAG